MTSEQKIAANRANARKSTGPRTSHGKARARANASRHGFATKGPPDAEAAKKTELICDLLLPPDADLVERQLAQTIAESDVLLARIRLARVQAIETMRMTGTPKVVPKYILDQRVDEVISELHNIQIGTWRPTKLRSLLKDGLAGIAEVEPDRIARLRSLTGRAVEGYRDGDRIPRSDAESVLLALPHLLVLDRYEKRALSRRRKAVEQLTAVADCKRLSSPVSERALREVTLIASR